MRCPKCTVAKLVELNNLVACVNCGYKKVIQEEEMTRIKGKCVLCEREDLMLDKKRELCCTCYNWSVRDGKPGVPPLLFAPAPQIKVLAKKKAVKLQPGEAAGNITCEACGKFIDQDTYWNRECPFCMGDPITGDKFTPPAVVAPCPPVVTLPIGKVSVFEKLVPLAPGIEMPLELMRDLSDAGVTTRDIEFMLRMLLAGQLRRAA